ncbi:4Fe-4S binding protein [Massilioclostridium coli]|uniref:4Fe-4S binding protein n=1 Tax=Massilioclostridium coli TaxID=1870991 RepID=UPI00085CBAC7|nr:4Fe-4S binding protein [Massilioclostridium coli]
MEINQVIAAYFSPTYSTRDIVLTISSEIQHSPKQIDLSIYDNRETSYSFSSHELVVLGVPVYGGRVPADATKRIHNLHGNNTPIVLVAVYGNREFEDALIELKDIVVSNGFIPVAAAAPVAQHSIIHSIAAGRPNAQDIQQARDFSKKVQDKLKKTVVLTQQDCIQLPGNQPYKKYGVIPLHPKAGHNCIQCGKCASNCPVHAIPQDHPDQTNTEQCISCMRCIVVCPKHARGLNPIVKAATANKLKKVCSQPKENLWIL